MHGTHARHFCWPLFFIKDWVLWLLACRTLIAPFKKLVPSCGSGWYSSNQNFRHTEIHSHACKNLTKAIWIIMLKLGGLLLSEYKKKYKCWENQLSKSKKAPQIAKYTLALQLGVHIGCCKPPLWGPEILLLKDLAILPISDFQVARVQTEILLHYSRVFSKK